MRTPASIHRAGTWSVANRIIGAATTLALTGMASGSLNVSELAVFLLTAGLLAVGNFADLGIPNATVTPLAAALSRSDIGTSKALVAEALRRLFRTAVWVLLVGTLVSVALTTIGREIFVPDSVDGREMGTALVALSACVAVGLPVSLFGRVLLASGHAIASANSGIAAQVVIALLGVVAWLTDAALPFFVALASCSTLLTGIVALFALRRLEPKLTPRLGDLRRPGTAGLDLGRSASHFLGIAIAGFIGFETDGLVIAAVLGSDEVPTFLVPARLLLLVPALAAVYFSPVWPLIAVNAEQGDLQLIRRRFRELLAKVAVVGAVATGVGGLLVIPVMDAITPSVVTPEADLILVLCLMSFIHTLSVPYAIVLSGLGLLRAQLVSAVAMAGTNIVLSVVFASWMGVIGPPIATVLCQTCLTLIPLMFVIRRRLAPSLHG